MKTKNQIITLYVSADLKAKIKADAKQNRRSVTAQVLTIVEDCYVPKELSPELFSSKKQVALTYKQGKAK